MAYLFPFGAVPHGGRVILYGIGEVGKDFYMQLRMAGDHCKLVAWTATTLDPYEVQPPFDYAKNIPNYDYDCVVIAVMEKAKAFEIKKTLFALGVPEEKQIWEPEYYIMGAWQMPANRMMMLKHLDYYMDILEERRQSESFFGGEGFYQSFLELGLTGQRNSGERIAFYHLREFLRSTDELLDVGCNCGFLSLQTAQYVKHITAYDTDEHLVRIAERTRQLLDVKNVEFHAGDYWKAPLEKNKYQAVFAFAIHYWVISAGVHPEDFVSRLYDTLAEDGYLFFESQDIRVDRELFTELCEMFQNRGMECVLHQNYKTDFEREVRVFRKLGRGDHKNEVAERKQTTTLSAPTMIEKIGDDYFVVDCWHHRILHNSRLSPDLNSWSIMPGKVLGGHSIAGNGELLIADSSDTDELLCFRRSREQKNGAYELSQTIDIRQYLPDGAYGRFGLSLARPHSVFYDPEKDGFLVSVSWADHVLLLRDHDGEVAVDAVITTPEFKNCYLKFIRKIDGDYWAAADGKLFRFQINASSLRMLAVYSLPPELRQYDINDFIKVGETYYITWQDFESSLGGLYELESPLAARGSYLRVLSVGEELGLNGMPYHISAFDDSFWLTEIGDKENCISQIGYEHGKLVKKRTLFDCGALTERDRMIRQESPMFRPVKR